MENNRLKISVEFIKDEYFLKWYIIFPELTGNVRSYSFSFKYTYLYGKAFLKKNIHAIICLSCFNYCSNS